MVERKKTGEKAIMGDEPKFEGSVERLNLIYALNWYNYFFSVPDSKKWLITYMNNADYTEDEINSVDRYKGPLLTQTLCSYARMVSRGADLKDWLDDKIQQILKDSVKEDEVVIKYTNNTTTTNMLIANIDNVLDMFYRNGYKNNNEIEAVLSEALKDNKASETRKALIYYKELLEEIRMANTDQDLKEGYKIKKVQFKNYEDFVFGITNHLEIGKENNKRVVKPRKKKPKTADQLTKKLKYLKVDSELNVNSIEPSQIIGKSVLWVFDSKTRKLSKYIAEDGKTLSVKGTSIVDYDQAKSATKIIRKPKDVIPKIVADAKLQIDKMFKNIKSKPSEPSGRINDRTILLKAFK